MSNQPNRLTSAASKSTHSLLVADSYAPIHRLFQRCFKYQFDEVLAAENEQDAEQMIQSKDISHIVISGTIAESAPTAELIARWRSQYPSIERVILHTGRAISSINCLTEFDGVLSKPSTKNTMEKVVFGDPS